MREVSKEEGIMNDERGDLLNGEKRGFAGRVKFMRQHLVA